ncbi:MAG: hypothetical protein ACYCWC_15365 [Rhodocyclaceae bacterium]
MNIVHLAYERHAALQNACVASHTARSAPCLASRLQADICPSYSFSVPYVLCHQPKSFDWRVRSAAAHPMKRLPDACFAEVCGVLNQIVQLS